MNRIQAFQYIDAHPNENTLRYFSEQGYHDLLNDKDVVKAALKAENNLSTEDIYSFINYDLQNDEDLVLIEYCRRMSMWNGPDMRQYRLGGQHYFGDGQHDISFPPIISNASHRAMRSTHNNAGERQIGPAWRMRNRGQDCDNIDWLPVAAVENADNIVIAQPPPPEPVGPPPGVVAVAANTAAINTSGGGGQQQRSRHWEPIITTQTFSGGRRRRTRRKRRTRRRKRRIRRRKRRRTRRRRK